MTAALGDGTRHCVRFCEVKIGDRDLGAFPREAARNRAADLATSAGDERHALGQPARSIAESWFKRH
jgi:hypothetical protein